MAVMRTVQGVPTMVLAAVTGQTGPNVLLDAGFVAFNLANQASTSVGSTPFVHAGEVVGAGRAWRDTRSPPLRPGRPTSLTWPGVSAERVLVDGKAIVAGAKRGRRVGSVMITLGSQRVVVPVALRGDLPKPTLLQRLF